MEVPSGGSHLKDGGSMIVNDQAIDPVSVLSYGAAAYPERTAWSGLGK